MFTALLIVLFTLSILAADAAKQARDYETKLNAEVYMIGFSLIGWCLILLNTLSYYKLA